MYQMQRLRQFSMVSGKNTDADEKQRLLLELTNTTIQQHYGNAEDRFSFYDAEDESPLLSQKILVTLITCKFICKPCAK